MSAHRIPSLAVLAFCLTTATTIARAQGVPAECQPLIDAQRKEITTPHHAYSTDGPAGQTAKAQTGETISTGGVTYLLYKGKWRRSPMTPKDQLDQMKENIASAKLISCKRVGSESVGGVPADVYTSHQESEEVTADARTWIARGSGLVLRTEEDLDMGGGGKRHISIRYEYTNVRAPAGAN